MHHTQRRPLAAGLALSLALAALAACSPDAADHPLAPSAPSLAARGADLPFPGTIEAVETTTFPPGTNTALIHLVGSGTATHLGRYTVVGDFTFDFATETATGPLTLTAANGDLLTATLVGGELTDRPGGGCCSLTDIYTITGGTGRFAGATGSFTIKRVLVFETGVSSGSFEGTVSLAH